MWLDGVVIPNSADLAIPSNLEVHFTTDLLTDATGDLFVRFDHLRVAYRE